MEVPFVSVIIPNLNNHFRLDLCLSALHRQTYPKAFFEIIVVDNGSKDQSVKIGKKYPVKLIVRDEFQSPYWCRNAGIEAAQGSVIALLDSNCIPAVTWLESGIQCLSKTPASIVTGPVEFHFSEPPSLAEKIDFLYSVFHSKDIPSRIALPATHLFIERTLFDEVGLFIPNIRSLGDIEWTQRARDRGFTFGWAERASVNYPAKDFKKTVKKMIRLGGGEKELWAAKDKSFFSVRWMIRILKNFFPPAPGFFGYMNKKNQDENTQISPIALYLGLYLIKLCYAWGMLFKRVNRSIPEIRNS